MKSMRSSEKSKFKELILHIAMKSQDDVKFGATKLNKLLFYSDFLYYKFYGTSITGQRYQKLDNGPAPIQLMPIFTEMQTHREAAWQDTRYFGKRQRRAIALRPPKYDSFSAQEIAFVDDLIEKCKPFSAKDISELSHLFIGWKLANNGEEIPYQVALVETGNDICSAAIAHGRSLSDMAKKYKKNPPRQ